MKKLFALLAVVLAVVSCQKDVDSLDVNVGGEQLVNITVGLPEATRAASGSGFDLASLSLEGSDYELRYILEIYVDGNTTDCIRQEVFTTATEEVVFPVRLVPQRNYRVVAWADIVPVSATERTVDGDYDYYYETSNGLDEVTIIENDEIKWNAMDEYRDAYTKFVEVNNFTANTAINLTLVRPFAKLRVVSTDIKNIEDLGFELKNGVVEYNVDLKRQFNALYGTADAASAKAHTFTYPTPYNDDDPDTDVNEAETRRTLFADYIFVDDITEQDAVQFTLSVYAQDGLLKTTTFNTDIALHANTLTTIIGEVLTEGGNVQIEINGELNEVEKYTVVSSASHLLKVINAGGDFILGNNIIVTADDVNEAQDIITRAAGATTTINLNGYTITLQADVEVEEGTTLIINDQPQSNSGTYGAIVSDGGQIVNNGTLNIEGGNVNDDVIENGENGMMIVDGAVATQAALNEAVKVEGATVKVKFGFYTFPTNIAEGVTIEAYTWDDGYVDYVQFQGKSNFDIHGNTVRRVNFWNDQDRVNAGYGSVINANFEECTFTGVLGIYEAWAGETCNFKKCTFCAPTYACNFSGDSPKNRAYFEECTFMGWNSFGVDATFNNCVFDSEKGGIYNVARVYGNTEFNDCQFVYGKLENKNNERIDLMNGSVASISNCTATNNGVVANIFDYINEADGAKLVVYINSNEEQELLNAAANVEGATVKVKSGYYTFPTNIAEGVTIEAYTKENGSVDFVQFQGKSNFDIHGNTVRGVNFWNDKDRVNSGNVINANFEECSFTGIKGIYGAYAGENCNFKKCTFCAPQYSCNFSSGGSNNGVYFEECTFMGWSSFGVDVSFDKCVFDSEAGGIYNIVRVYGETTFDECEFVYGKIKDEAVCLDSIKSGKTVEFTGCYVTNANNANDNITKHFANYNYGNTVIIDGTQYTFEAKGVLKVGDNTYHISNAAGLMWLADLVNAGKNYFAEKTIKLVADIDLNNEEWTPIGSAYMDHGFMGNFDGNGYTIKNLNITELTPDSDNYVYAGLFGVTEGVDANNENYIKNLTIENVTIETEGHIVAAAVAYPYYTNLENITVNGAVNIKGGDYTAGVLAYTRRCVNAKNIAINANAGSVIEGTYTIGGVISDIQMNGGLTANYSNFEATGLTIKGTKCVGGISGIIGNQTLNGATVKNVVIVSDDARKGTLCGSFDGECEITNAVVENVTGADNFIGGLYEGTASESASITINRVTYTYNNGWLVD